jgi:hypothetical protein
MSVETILGRGKRRPEQINGQQMNSGTPHRTQDILDRIAPDLSSPVPSVRQPIEAQMPEYVEPQEGVNQIGILTSVAMAQEYERTAKEVEFLGEELKAAKLRAEEVSVFLDETIKHIESTAVYFRSECKRVVKQLEDYAILTEQVRRTCQQMVGDIKETAAGVGSQE